MSAEEKKDDVPPAVGEGAEGEEVKAPEPVEEEEVIV
jgi:hypothetical protein